MPGPAQGSHSLAAWTAEVHKSTRDDGQFSGLGIQVANGSTQRCLSLTLTRDDESGERGRVMWGVRKVSEPNLKAPLHVYITPDVSTQIGLSPVIIH